jgi:hypothetical protein
VIDESAADEGARLDHDTEYGVWNDGSLGGEFDFGTGLVDLRGRVNFLSVKAEHAFPGRSTRVPRTPHSPNSPLSEPFHPPSSAIRPRRETSYKSRQ